MEASSLQESATCSDAVWYVEDMVKNFMPRFQFTGEAAKFVGQVGKQPELALLCKCCGKDERKKTLICDVCENSFHLKCLKLRSADVVLCDRWLCAECSAADGGHPFNSTCHKRSALRSSSRRRHLCVQKIPPQEEEDTGKIRFVLKLKTAHFKGSRALTKEVVEVPSDRSTDESTEGCVRRRSCQMDCASYTQFELVNPPVVSSEDVGKELIRYDRARNKRAKVAENVMESPRHPVSAMPSSCGVECTSSGDCHHFVSNFYLCGGPSQDLNLAEAAEIRNEEEEEKSLDDLCSGKDVEVIPGSSQIKCSSLALVCKPMDSDLYLLETATEEVLGLRKDEVICIKGPVLKENEESVCEPAIEQSPLSVIAEEHPKQEENACMNGIISKMDLQAIASSSSTKILGKVDTLEKPREHIREYQKVCADTDVRPKLCVRACTHERVQMSSQEKRSLVEVVDDIRKGPWYEDAIELMGLEPVACSGKHSLNYHKATLPSKQHSQLHVKLNTWCLLQAYANCRERCIVVYDLGKANRDDSEVLQKTVDIERTWSVGRRFYVLLLGTKEAANESVCSRIIPFQGGIGYAIPYVPSFSPMQELQDTCPVWVTFVHLPVYFYPFLQELAMSLGKLLYAPPSEARESSDSPRVCVCWQVSKSIPEFLYVDMDGLGCKKLKIEFDLSLLRNLSKLCYQEDASVANG